MVDVVVVGGEGMGRRGVQLLAVVPSIPPMKVEQKESV